MPLDPADETRRKRAPGARQRGATGPGGQGYGFWISHNHGKVIQTGAAPDRTSDEGILFCYGFKNEGGKVMPQSFYFSGVPAPVPNAPIVSQNYTDFREVRPDPVQTWGKVSSLDLTTLPECQLFEPPQQVKAALQASEPAPTWGTIGRKRKP